MLEYDLDFRVMVHTTPRGLRHIEVTGGCGKAGNQVMEM